jgi:hypothetical protein
MKQGQFFFERVTVKIVDVEVKKRQLERAGFTFRRELSPEEARLPRLKSCETVLVFSHPLT